MFKTKQRGFSLSLFLFFCILILSFLLVSNQAAIADCPADGCPPADGTPPADGAPPADGMGPSDPSIPAVTPTPIVSTPTCGSADGQAFSAPGPTSNLCGGSSYLSGSVSISGADWVWECGLQTTTTTTTWIFDINCNPLGDTTHCWIPSYSTNTTYGGPYISCNASISAPVVSSSVSLSANPTAVSLGGSTVLTWDISGDPFRSCFLRFPTTYLEYQGVESSSLGCGVGFTSTFSHCMPQVAESVGTHTVTLNNLDPLGVHTYEIVCYCNDVNNTIERSSASVNVTANVTNPVIYNLAVVKSGTGSGTVTSSPVGINCDVNNTDCSEDYASGTSVTLTATRATGSTFSGWLGGGCPSTGNSCAVVMNLSTTVMATFDAVVPIISPCDPTCNCGNVCSGSACYSGCGIYCKQGERDCSWEEIAP